MLFIIYLFTSNLHAMSFYDFGRSKFLIFICALTEGSFAIEVMYVDENGG